MFTPFQLPPVRYSLSGTAVTPPNEIGDAFLPHLPIDFQRLPMLSLGKEPEVPASPSSYRRVVSMTTAPISSLRFFAAFPRAPRVVATVASPLPPSSPLSPHVLGKEEFRKLLVRPNLPLFSGTRCRVCSWFSLLSLRLGGRGIREKPRRMRTTFLFPISPPPRRRHDVVGVCGALFSDRCRFPGGKDSVPPSRCVVRPPGYHRSFVCWLRARERLSLAGRSCALVCVCVFRNLGSQRVEVDANR